MNITGSVPLLGPYMRTLLQGGEEMGNLTLTRFFSLHGFVLPGSIFALIAIHVYLFRRAGVTTHWWKKEAQLLKEQEPFWPGQAWRDGILALVLLFIMVAWTWYRPAPLGNVADPSRPYEARPEWYFMSLFLLLRFFEGPYAVVGTVVIPGLVFAILFLWPLLDRNPERDPRKRPVAMTLLILGVLALSGLTTCAIATDTKQAEPEEKGGGAPAAVALRVGTR
jgi:ubiquinol-cytochrome c reductase cytochrome b subunit